MQCVSLNCYCLGCDSTTPAELRCAAHQHLMRKIGGDDRSRVIWAVVVQRQRHVSGAAAEVENHSVGAREDFAKTTRGAPPPPAVDVQRKDVIEQVVTRRNAVEHFADGGGSGLFVDRTRRFCTERAWRRRKTHL